MPLIKIDNCLDCPHRLVVADPDPSDWFCDTDVAVLCNLADNMDGFKTAKNPRPFSHRPVTVSCSPVRVRRECTVPSWCPLELQALKKRLTLGESGVTIDASNQVQGDE